MKPGSGLGLYGIEVAKHLRLPENVLNDAYAIRNKYFSTNVKLSELRPSRYNAKVIVTKCKVPDCHEDATETHHIRYQAAGQTVDGSHKNVSDNLAPLCERHHQMTHTGHEGEVLVIFGYRRDGVLDCRMRRKVPSLM